ncbi:MAG: hypothetical protein KC609_10710 [Myxococcales bacterium]|nr:hypothetical protein [Myxococcales bacterium]
MKSRLGTGAYFALLALVVLAFEGCGGGAKNSNGCSGANDCPTGALCIAGSCTIDDGDATGDGTNSNGDQDQPTPDEAGLGGDQIAPEDSTLAMDLSIEENCAPDGAIVCFTSGSIASYRKCIAGIWLETKCLAKTCEGVTGVPNSGVQPGLCQGGLGCLLTVCETCPGNTLADPLTATCYSGCADGLGEPHSERCLPGFECANGSCVPASTKSENGETCNADGDCRSGACVRTLVDGKPDSSQKICCAAACKGTCQYCGVGGQCLTLEAGKPDPESCTGEDPSTCGLTGNCGENGDCESWPDGTKCADGTCKDGTEFGVSLCKSGNCQPPSGTLCTDGAICKGTSCGAKDCSQNADCADLTGGSDTWFCRKDPAGGSGFCAKKLDSLTVCQNAAQNNSDGDNSACKSGICATDDFEGHTGSAKICVPASSCNWNGTTVVPENTTYCGGNDFSMTCLGGSWTNKELCLGGPCEAFPGEPNTGFRTKKCVIPVAGCLTACPSCGGFLANGTGCLKECAADSDCRSTFYCDKATKSCTKKASAGIVCSANNQCLDGACVESSSEGTRVCCGESCSGNCRFCAEKADGSWGCTLRNAGSEDGFCSATDTQDPECGHATCSGVGESCSFPGSSQPCNGGQQLCKPAESKLYGYRCNGQGGCEEYVIRDCALGCNAGNDGCQDACTSHASCPDGTFCAATGACLPKLADGDNCTKRSISGMPDDAVCEHGSCTKDNLTLYKDVNGSQTAYNTSGGTDETDDGTTVYYGYYCRPVNGCIDAVNAGGLLNSQTGQVDIGDPVARTYAQNYYRCDEYYRTAQSGVRGYLCNGAQWVLPSTVDPKLKTYCDVSEYRPTNKYPGDGTPNTKGYYPGYKETICEDGVIGGLGTAGCRVVSRSCSPYMHEGGSNEKCFGTNCQACEGSGFCVIKDSDARCLAPSYGCESGSCLVFGYIDSSPTTLYNCQHGSQCQSGLCLKGLHSDGITAVCAALLPEHCPAGFKVVKDYKCYVDGTSPTSSFCTTTCSPFLEKCLGKRCLGILL